MLPDSTRLGSGNLADSTWFVRSLSGHYLAYNLGVQFPTCLELLEKSSLSNLSLGLGLLK